MKKKFIFGFLLFILYFEVYSQENNKYHLTGIVVDTSGVEISNVEIYDDNGFLFAVSDKNGSFDIYVKQEMKLNFSHINFQNNSINFNINQLDSLKDGSFPLVVVMKIKYNLLPEAYVIENVPHLAYKNEEVWVVDYKVTQDGIFLIANKSFRNILLLLDYKQDTISKKMIAYKFNRLYQDGFGNIHLLSEDSTYQVYYDGNKLQLIYGISYKQFETNLLPLVAVTDSIIVMERRMYHDQEIVYEAINRNTKQRFFLADIYNERKEMAKSWNMDNYRFVLANNADINGLFIDRRNDVNEDRNNFMDEVLKRLMLKPIYSPIYHINDYLYIFDLQSNNIIKFDKTGNEIKKIQISFHQKSFNKKLVINNSWDNNLIIDSYLGYCYAQYENEGIVTLKKIDIETSNILKEFVLDKHSFPTNIQIFNDEIFYLYRDFKSNNIDRRSLYKMKIQ